jgi:hypothetical protein
MESSKKTDDMYSTVDKFIQRVHDKDYTITKEASEIVYGRKSEGRVGKLLGTMEETGILADRLAWAMGAYESSKDDPHFRDLYGTQCLFWINRAYSRGVVKEGEGSVHKLRECQEKNTKLDSDVTELSAKLLILQGKYDELLRQKTEESDEQEDWQNENR